METKKYLMDSDIDELMEDWFDRDGETFMKISDKHRVGWEDTLEEGASYSSYLLESPDKYELLKRAYELAGDMITVMNIPFKVKVIISTESKVSATDGQRLQVATCMFDDAGITVGEQLDAFIGTTVHEGCHLLYSDFDSLVRRKPEPIIKMLANVIEDERIEQTLGQDKPGLARFLEKSKYYWFDSLYLEDYKEEEGNIFEKIFNIFLRIMRYPTYLKEEDIVYFGHHLFKVKDIVKVLPTDTDEAIDQAEKVFEVFKEFYTEKEEEERERAEGAEGEESDEEYDEDEEGDESDEGDGDDGDKKGTGEGDGEGKAEEKSKPKPRDIAEDAKRTVRKMEEFTPPKDLSKSKVSEEVTRVKGDVIEGTISVGRDKDSFFRRAETDSATYMESYNRIRRYIPAIAKVISGHMREYKLVHKSMRSGVLDTTKLAEAYQGVSTVYMREGEVKTDKVSVVVLIDESGSMHGSRIAAARDTAVLINEAIGKIPQVELFIYGHTGDMLYNGSTEMITYREKNFTRKHTLGSVRAQSQNRDGVAIYETAVRVRRQTQNPTLMFVLSDGEPAAGSYTGSTAIAHVRQSVKKTEKLGFSVVQVCINHSYNPASMFDHFVILEDMSRLAIELGKVIKKATLKAAKVHVS